MRWEGIAAAIIFIIACLVVLGLATDFIVDWLWFSSVGYFDVFWVMFRAKLLLFLAAFIVSTFSLWVNAALASHFSARQRLWLPGAAGGIAASGQTLAEALLALLGPSPRRRWHLTVGAAVALLGILIAWAWASDWEL